MNKKRLIMIGAPLIVVIIAGVAAYQFLMPKPAEAKPHLVGSVYTLPGAFTLNLAGDHYATLTVAVLLPAMPKTGLADQPVIRSIITNDVTGQPADSLITAGGRAALEREILADVNRQTNAVVTQIYFTDLAVQ